MRKQVYLKSKHTKQTNKKKPKDTTKKKYK